jgi:hypothetical protein
LTGSGTHKRSLLCRGHKILAMEVDYPKWMILSSLVEVVISEIPVS